MPQIQTHFPEDSSREALALQSIAVPSLKVQHGRWAVTRTHNTEDMAAKWRDCPHLVMVLSDPKLDGMDLAIIRNDLLQFMQKLVRDLVSGEVDVRHQLEALLEKVSLMVEVVQSNNLDKHNELIEKTLKVVRRAEAQASSSLHLRKAKSPVVSSPLTEEEKKILAETGDE